MSVKNDFENLSYVGENLLYDYKFCKDVIKLLKKVKNSTYGGWESVLQSFKNEKIIYDKDFVIEAINNGANLWFENKIYERYLDDEDIMIRALIKDDHLFSYLPEKYRDNEKYAIAALTNSMSSDDLSEMQTTIELVKNICKGTSYQGIVSQTMNSSFFTEAGNNLKFVSDRLKNNKKVVLYAISQTKSSFIYASEELKEDIDVLRKLLEPEVIENENINEIIINLIKANPYLYNYYGEKYRANYELTLNVIDNYESDYDDKFDLKVPFDKFNDTQLINIYKKILKKCKTFFKEIPDKYKNNKEIVLIAIKTYGNNLQYAGDKFKNNEELIELARKQMEDYNRNEIFYLDRPVDNKTNGDEIKNIDDPFADFFVDDLPF